MADLIRQFKDLRFHIFYGAILNHRHPVIELGNRVASCHWQLCPEGLNACSVVYSGGVGCDVSFEHELVRRFGCSVVLFDPSPPGVATMALPENKIPQFKHHAVALAGQCGTLKFAPPLGEGGNSWFMQTAAVAQLEVPCVDLETLMRQNGHTHIDLLKIDIEGAEYEVLDNLLKNRLPVRQVLVEFHHNLLPGYRRSQTIRAILKMLKAGYRLLNRDGENHTFLKPAG